MPTPHATPNWEEQPGGQKKPGSHWRHAVDPARYAYVPAAHGVHALLDVVDVKVPALQALHVFVDASRPLPGGQRVATNVGDGVVLGRGTREPDTDVVCVFVSVGAPRVPDTDGVCVFVGD